jgi:hypothetical protein
VIDTQGDGGNGAVIEKNIPIIQNVILRAGGITACKHANGRDYWLVIAPSVINKFYTFLITPDSILGPFEQTIGPKFPLPYENAYSKFSQDGSKFATGIFEGAPVLIMDFDRCTGLFSNPKTIHFNTSGNPESPVDGCTSLEFSPNGRFLYTNTSAQLAQYDLQANNIQDSAEIHSYDSTDRYGLGFLQCGPNGKLYCSTWNGGLDALHVINNPNLPGDSADFVYGGQPVLTDNSNNVPNLINYKLGPLIGSGCDTIPTYLAQQAGDKRLLRVLPNPADKYIYVEMGMPGNYEFDLLNETGQLADSRQTRQVDNFDTERLSAGVYFLSVNNKDNGSIVAIQKVVVVH